MARAQPQRHRAKRVLLKVGLLLASALLAFAVFAPLMTIKKLVLWSNTLSLMSSLQTLWVEGHHVLFTIVALFSLVVPAAKLCVLFLVLFRPSAKAGVTRRLLTLMHEFGRWAMLDVMVVAVLLVAVKLGAIVSVQVHHGLYLFTAAVLLIAAITHWVASDPPRPIRRAKPKRRVASTG